MLTKSLEKKKHRKLNSLHISSEDDPESRIMMIRGPLMTATLGLEEEGRRIIDLRKDSEIWKKNVMMKISSIMILSLIVQNGRKVIPFGRMKQKVRKVMIPGDGNLRLNNPEDRLPAAADKQEVTETQEEPLADLRIQHLPCLFLKNRHNQLRLRRRRRSERKRFDDKSCRRSS